jgi:CheY-like chemotaxis protein
MCWRRRGSPASNWARQAQLLITLGLLLPKLVGPKVLRSLKNDIKTADIPPFVLSGLSKMNEPKRLRKDAPASLQRRRLPDSPELPLEGVTTTLTNGQGNDLAR